MFLNEKDLRYSRERQRDLRREAEQQRLASQSRRAERKSQKHNSPLWLRVWSLF
jgi:hypothetical protein